MKDIVNMTVNELKMDIANDHRAEAKALLVMANVQQLICETRDAMRVALETDCEGNVLNVVSHQRDAMKKLTEIAVNISSIVHNQPPAYPDRLPPQC